MATVILTSSSFASGHSLLIEGTCRRSTRSFQTRSGETSDGQLEKAAELLCSRDVLGPWILLVFVRMLWVENLESFRLRAHFSRILVSPATSWVG
jgi:hypothetical protein